MSMSRTDEGTTHSAPGTGTVSDERLLAVQLFNGTWRLLKMESRTGADADLMLHMAHASRFHRAQVPAATPAHYARGEWLISRVYAVLWPARARALPCPPGARYLRRKRHRRPGPGLRLRGARACAWDHRRARVCTDRALSAARGITQRGDRELLRADLETIPGQVRYW